MIVDTSAAVAMLRGEPQASAMVQAMNGAEQLWMSAASVLELSIVTRDDDPTLMDDFFGAMALTEFGFRRWQESCEAGAGISSTAGDH